LAILGEEFGEAFQAIQPLLGIETTKETDADNFAEELLHVAAVALAMYEQFIDPDYRPTQNLKANIQVKVTAEDLERLAEKIAKNPPPLRDGRI
jgi:hypothetical protein